MSETNILEKKIKKLSKELKKIPDEFWVRSEGGQYEVIWILDQEDGTAGSYETSQERLGITREGDILWGYSSGCSCWSGWDSNDYCPTVSVKEFKINMFKEQREGKSYSESELNDWEGLASSNLDDFLFLVSEKTTPKQVLEVKNAEIRRYLIKRIGYDNIKKYVKAEVLHKDGENELLRFENGEMYVKVKDTSTERDYLLFVEGRHETCRSAIAWTFGLREEEYNPIIES